MLNFILQDSIIYQDQGIELIKSKEYWNWRNSGRKNEWEKTIINIFSPGQELPKNIPVRSLCPVGTVEFVEEWIKTFWRGIELKPINIPQQLTGLDYTGRRIVNIQAGEKIPFNIGDKIFAKSMNKIKDERNGVYYIGSDNFCNLLKDSKEEWQISEYIEDIISEWRIFVHNDNIVDIKCYSGDPFVIPDKDRVIKIIKTLNKNSPYTLDLLCTKEESFVLELHDFFSCGLYGMSEPSVYPFMLYRCFKKIVNSE